MGCRIGRFARLAGRSLEMVSPVVLGHLVDFVCDWVESDREMLEEDLVVSGLMLSRLDSMNDK